ncbi:MAG: WG repeat-containing protein [Bacteroidota bacterium]
MKTLLLIITLTISLSVFSQEKPDSTKKDSSIQASYPTNWSLVERHNKQGFIDTYGNIVVEPKYDYIYPFGEFQENWALVQKNSKFGFIDNAGCEVVKPKYSNIEQFDKYKKGWALVEKHGKMGFIDRDGCEILKPQFSSINVFIESDECVDFLKQ